MWNLSKTGNSYRESIISNSLHSSKSSGNIVMTTRTSKKNMIPVLSCKGIYEEPKTVKIKNILKNQNREKSKHRSLSRKNLISNFIYHSSFS